MARSRGLIPPGLVRVPDRAGLPELGRSSFVLLHGERRAADQSAPGARTRWRRRSWRAGTGCGGTLTQRPRVGEVLHDRRR